MERTSNLNKPAARKRPHSPSHQQSNPIAAKAKKSMFNASNKSTIKSAKRKFIVDIVLESADIDLRKIMKDELIKQGYHENTCKNCYEILDYLIKSLFEFIKSANLQTFLAFYNIDKAKRSHYAHSCIMMFEVQYTASLQYDTKENELVHIYFLYNNERKIHLSMMSEICSQIMDRFMLNQRLIHNSTLFPDNPIMPSNNNSKTRSILSINMPLPDTGLSLDNVSNGEDVNTPMNNVRNVVFEDIPTTNLVISENRLSYQDFIAYYIKNIINSFRRNPNLLTDVERFVRYTDMDGLRYSYNTSHETLTICTTESADSSCPQIVFIGSIPDFLRIYEEKTVTCQDYEYIIQ